LAELAPTGTVQAVVAQAVATIALGLLGASGIAKLIDPDPTTGAMGTAGLPSSNLLSRLLGLAETIVAVAALAVGGPLIIASAALFYLAFAIFTFAALANRIPLQSCGCFGREDTPPTTIHVVYNFVSVVGLVALLVTGLDPIDWTAAPADLLLYLGFAAIGVYASYLLMTRLPRLQVLARSS
jgi:uncharacterized membrane protein YphA (DoxX/SURF4 family)